MNVVSKEVKGSVQKAPKAKKKTAQKTDTPKRKYTKRKANSNVVFVQAFECSFTNGDSSMSIFVNASSFQEAASKVEAIQSDKSIKGRLSTIRNIGIAVQ